MSSSVQLGGEDWAFQLDGLITLNATGAFTGNAFVFKYVEDLEIFSSNNLGAINGQGYVNRYGGPGSNTRLLRVISGNRVSVHNIVLVDSPAFHLIFDGVNNTEVYYMTIR